MAFLLTGLAGLSTGIGSLLAFFIKSKDTKYLTLAMGFAAGVMLYVSFMEILPEAMEGLEEYYNTAVHGVEQTMLASFGEVPHAAEHEFEHMHNSMGGWIAIIAFFVGMFVVVLIDKLVPSSDNPHELEQPTNDEPPNPVDKSKLKRIGILTALALAIHNFPEGIATFVAALEDPTLGVTIAIAIALHNIPEGVAVSMPIYYATGSRSQAFWYSFLSGLVEPLGAFLGYLVLMPFLTPEVMSLLLAGVGGIMVFIALDQLIPAAEKYGQHHWCIYGVVAGMVVMAVSLLLLDASGGHHH